MATREIAVVPIAILINRAVLLVISSVPFRISGRCESPPGCLWRAPIRRIYHTCLAMQHTAEGGFIGRCAVDIGLSWLCVRHFRKAATGFERSRQIGETIGENLRLAICLRPYS